LIFSAEHKFTILRLGQREKTEENKQCADILLRSDLRRYKLLFFKWEHLLTINYLEYNFTDIFTNQNKNSYFLSYLTLFSNNKRSTVMGYKIWRYEGYDLKIVVINIQDFQGRNFSSRSYTCNIQAIRVGT